MVTMRHNAISISVGNRTYRHCQSMTPVNLSTTNTAVNVVRLSEQPVPFLLLISRLLPLLPRSLRL